VAEQVEARVPGDGRRVDDLSAGALPLHLLGGGLHAVHDAEQVDLEHPLQVRGRQLQERLDLRDARVGHHDVDAAQLGGRPLDHGEHGRPIGHVAR